MKVIFLDKDGVLNGYGLGTCILTHIEDAFHLQGFIAKHHDFFGTRTRLVKRLAKLCRKTGAKVVLTMSTRHGWNVPYEKKHGRLKEFQRKINKYGIEVIGVTPTSDYGRGYEIKNYLFYNKDVSEFVILDDENFNIAEMFPDNFVRTSSNGIIKGSWTENTGLKRRHVRQAIHILNGKSK